MNILEALVLGTPSGGEPPPEPLDETILPDGDDPNGAQSLLVSGGSTYYNLLNDDSDSTYAVQEVDSECPSLNSGSARVTMANPSGPVPEDQTVKTRVRVLAAEALGTFGQELIRVRIYEGTTLRVTDQSTSLVKDVRTWVEYTWSAGEVASITDWDNLRMDLYAEGCVTAEGQDCQIQFIEAQIVFEP